MGQNRIKKNPIKVLSIPVEFRNAKGRFTKPHLASQIIVKIEGVKFDFDVPRFRPKTKEKVLLYASEIVNELKLQFYGADVVEIEARRTIAPKKRAKKATDKVTYQTEISEAEYHSKKFKQNYKRIAYYYWFKPPYEISPNAKRTDEIMKLLYNFAYKKGIEVINKHKLKGWKYQIKIVGGGKYHLKGIRRGEDKEAASTFGFSLPRFSVQNRKAFKNDIALNQKEFMQRVVTGDKGNLSYFLRMTDSQLDENKGDRVLFIYGVKLDFVRKI